MTHEFRTSAPDGTEIAWSRTAATAAVGDAVVLVHGITESAATFDPLIDRLAGAATEVITLDLRGHGESGTAGTYDLASMAGDVIAVIDAAYDTPPARTHLVGHSLGGAVVSAVGAGFAVDTVVNIDQSLELAAFKLQLSEAEALLRDPDQFQSVIDMLFDSMSGDLLAPTERDRIASLRRADQDVVLGVWDLLLTSSELDIANTVDSALAGYRARPTRYLSIFGLDPGPGYPSWIESRIPGATTEVWADHGHYPHLVDPSRFCARLQQFWNG